MKRLLLISWFILILCHAPAWAEDPVLVIKNEWYAPYKKAFDSSKKHHNYKSTSLYIKGLSNEEVRQEVRGKKHSIILTIGWDAFYPVKEIGNKPIVYAYADGAREKHGVMGNVTGVAMHPPPSLYISTLKTALPSVNSVGVIFTKRTRHLIREAREAAGKCGVTLLVLEAEDRGDVPDLLKRMRGNISAFWMTPNYDLWDAPTLARLFNFSLKYKVPVLTYSKRFLKDGAFMAVSSSPWEIGRHLAKIIRDIQNGGDVKTMEVIRPERLRLVINGPVIRDLFLTVSKEILAIAEEWP